MEYRSKLYLGLSFLAGILLTLGFKDVYPDLERRFRQRRQYRRFSQVDAAALKAGEHVSLKDNTRPNSKPDPEDDGIAEGIEGCIGNTPLFKIKSLSDATGCEILGKAEVWTNTR